MRYLQSQKIHPLILAASLIVLIACLYWAESFLKPIALSILLAFLLNPIVSLFQKKGIRRVPAVIVTSLITFSILIGMGWIIASQIKDLANDLPQYKENIKKKVIDFRTVGKNSTLGKVQETVHEVSEALKEEKNIPENVDLKVQRKEIKKPSQDYTIVHNYQPSGFSQFSSILSPVLGQLINVFLVIILVIFMLIELPQIRNRLIRLLGYGHLHITTRAFEEAGERMSRYLLMQLFINTFFGVCVSVGLFFIKVPYALGLGFIAALARFIPYIGPWLGLIGPVLVSLAVFNNWGQLLSVLGLFLALELNNNFLLEPRLYSHSAGVSQFSLLVAITFWTWLWGPLGLFLAPPLTVCLVILGKYIPQMEFLVILLGDQPVMKPSLAYYQRLLARDQDEATRIIQDFLKLHSIEKVYDELLIPVLCYLKKDRESYKLSSDDEEFACQVIRKTITDFELKHQISPDLTNSSIELPVSKIKILGYPLHDEEDEIALIMLGQLMAEKKPQIEILSHKCLFSEVITLIQEKSPQVVCFVSLPTDSLSRVRLFSKRVKRQFPDLKILVGRWGSKNRDEKYWKDLFSMTVDECHASIIEAKNWIYQIAHWVLPATAK